MGHEHSAERYRSWYAALLRLYPRRYRDRFGEPMAQTFSDLLRERERAGRPIAGGAAWMFAETSAGILRETMNSIVQQNRSILWLAMITVTILAIPLVAMQFSSEWDWKPFDFLLAGALIFGSGLAFILIARRMPSRLYRAGLAVAIGTCFLIVWVNGAVGFVGNEDNPANALYFLVPLTGVIGSLVARFRPGGMAVASIAAAIVHSVAGVVALFVWRVPESVIDAIDGQRLEIYPAVQVRDVLINVFVLVLLLAAAMLFRQASRVRA
jgi:hypothetical protein